MTLKPEHIVEELNRTPKLKRDLIMKMVEVMLDSEAFLEAYPRLYDPALAEVSSEYREKVREELAQIIVRLFHKNKVRMDDASDVLYRARRYYLEMYVNRDKPKGEREYARGNGDGQIVPTITGDHESRITDYTAIAVDLYNGAVTGDTATSITCRSIASHSGPQVMESYGIGNGQAHSSVTKEKSGTLDTMHDAQAVAIEHMELPKKIAWIVRRLTPTECERLQGYPDGWTDIGEWTDTKGKKHKAADSPRYKALGNSIALPQWFWIVQKMKPYMRDGAKLGSLFDGIGGFPLVFGTGGSPAKNPHPLWKSGEHQLCVPYCVA